MNGNGRDCTSVLTAFASRRLAGWQGLPAHCTLDDAQATLQVQKDWFGFGTLGSRCLARRYTLARAPGWERNVRIWLDGERIVLLDVEITHEGVALTDLCSELGEPDARFRWHLDIVPVPDGELVYASRGIALFTYPPGKYVMRLAVFAPVMVDEYRESVRLDLEARLFHAGD